MNPRERRFTRLVLTLLGCLLAATGCAHRVWNSRLDDLKPAARYEFSNRLPENREDLFIVLAFSGGGTRAAAFSYGVLQALRDTRLNLNGTNRRLLDEVDVITSVSGGSYTAAYYGLFGDRIFTDFTNGFLYRDWQGELIRLSLRPGSLAAISSRKFNRSDLVAAYLDRTLFQHRTFQDMSRNGRPFVIINASDINNAITFSFIQQQFDFLCSDLSTYPVANAVMASSAVPGPFVSIALRNYEDCPERHRPWVAEALACDDVLDRRRSVALALDRYSNPDRMPVLRLVDGGVTDNLGVRGSMMSPVAHYGNVPDMAGAFTPERLQRVRNVLVVVANAQVDSERGWSVSGREPSLLATVQSSFDAALGILNTETVSLAKQGFLMWQDHVNAARPPGAPKVKVHFAVLTFNQIEDRQTRDRFNAMPTTFRLNPDQVDALIAQSKALLERSPEFKAFLQRVEQPESGQSSGTGR
jgi:NTE family protein